MKKILFFIACWMWVAIAQAVPANPTPATVTQPDGSTLTIMLQGDEFYHFNTTLDGYTVVKNSEGVFTYAQRQKGGAVAASAVVAHNAEERTAVEKAFLASTPRFMIDETALATGQKARASRHGRKKVGADGQFDYAKFKGLVILVNYTDVQFSRGSSFYDSMINTKNYDGYTEDGVKVDFQGSVRDYYRDNSMGVFDPHFDVLGPVNVNFASTDAHGHANAQPIFVAALDAIDSEVDFSKYDTDGDGYVDMVFFIVAGYTANYSGNDGNLLWPHMSYLYTSDRDYDGVRFGLYACSGEIYGWQSQGDNIPDGIGAICHEFSHVLGLPDLYDTDYTESGGQSDHPGKWDVMAGGSYWNYSRNPVGYSMFERAFLGFANPDTIESAGDYTLHPLNNSNEGYILKTDHDKEFFVIENRQQTGWDSYLLGHGMMVARVDMSDEHTWAYNQVNANPDYQCYQLLRAGNMTGGSASDPFPGTSNVTEITNTTTPNLCTHAGLMSSLVIKDIEETSGNITFKVLKDGDVKEIVEDFESMALTGNTSPKKVRGNFVEWDFVKSNVVSTSGGQFGNGAHAVAIKKAGALLMSRMLNFNPFLLTAEINNPTSSQATFKLYYKTNEADPWTEAGQEVLVEPNSKVTALWKLNTKKPTMYSIVEFAGPQSKACMIDDVTFKYYPVPGDVNLDGVCDSSDVDALINMVISWPNYLPLSDQNGDDKGNVADVTALVNRLLGIR